MASSPLCYVSSEELVILADRLGRIDSSKLGELLGLDQETVATLAKEGDDQLLYRLLTTWRDEQVIGSDIRGCLAHKLWCDFSDESAFLSNTGKEGGKDSLHKTREELPCFIYIYLSSTVQSAQLYHNLVLVK